MTDPTTVVDPGRTSRVERLIPWLGGALLLGLLATWAIGTARYGGPDEPAHVLRASAVAHGQVQGEVPDSASIELAPGYRIVDVPASLASGDPACFRHDSAVTPDCAVPSTSTATVPAATSAGVNPPLYWHWPRGASLPWHTDDHGPPPWHWEPSHQQPGSSSAW